MFFIATMAFHILHFKMGEKKNGELSEARSYGKSKEIVSKSSFSLVFAPRTYSLYMRASSLRFVNENELAMMFRA